MQFLRVVPEALPKKKKSCNSKASKSNRVTMESEVMKENNDPHIQKPPKSEQKEKEIKIQSPIHDSPTKPQSPNMESYDPNRIPASVFSTKTVGTSKSSQAEWSGSSNESLFSIQMGNNSFSNDYAIMYGKSQDLDHNNPQLKSEERNYNNRHIAPAKSSDLNSLPPVMEQEEGSLQSDESSRVEKKDNSPLINQSPNDAFTTPATNPRISSDSNKSFAFPVLTNVSGKKEQSIKVEPDEAEKDEQTEVQAHVQMQQPPTQKTNKWFSCFSCRCC